MPQVIFKDLGLIDYKEAWDFQESLFKSTVDDKIKIRNGEQGLETKNYLLFCEHPHVYTLGKSGDESHLLLNQDELANNNANFYKINRGGDITYHGPGQLVAYPIFDLDHFFSDIHKYIRLLEDAIIRTLLYYGLKGIREEGYTGVWLEADSKNELRKICAIGVHLSRWVTMHGFAFNINTNLSHFSNIIPCGIQENNRGITSLQYELGKTIPLTEVKEILLKNLQEIFSFQSVTE